MGDGRSEAEHARLVDLYNLQTANKFVQAPPRDAVPFS